MYKILGGDKKEYGPVSVDQVRQWIAEGRVAGQTQVQAEGSSEWKSLAEFREFDAALTAKALTPSHQPTAGPASTPPPISPKRLPASGLAITSLVLGVLSFFGCSIIAGIPAIITGHIAHNRSRRTPPQSGGGGLAIAGFVLGYISLAFLPIMLGLMLPALAKAKQQAQRIQCVNNLKQIGLAARIWASNNGEKLPPDFNAMFNELATPAILICPGDSTKTPALSWADFGPGNVSYEFLEPGINEKDAVQMVVFQCPIHGNVAMGDGSVQQGGQRTRRIRR